MPLTKQQQKKKKSRSRRIRRMRRRIRRRRRRRRIRRRIRRRRRTRRSKKNTSITHMPARMRVCAWVLAHLLFFSPHLYASAFSKIFVAIGIDLGGFFKADVTSERLGETLVIFATAWLTWFVFELLSFPSVPSHCSFTLFFSPPFPLAYHTHSNFRPPPN